MTTIETLENPKMLDIYVKQAWHNVFCYACAYEEVPNQRNEKKLLLALVSGADSAIQSVRAVIDIGTHGGVRFGYGVKEERDYRFVSEYELFTEKGMYEKFPMTLTNSRKGLVVVHEDVLMNGKYFLSFEENPAQDVAKFLGGSPFGLRIEPQWAETVYEELLKQDFLRKMDFYKDEMLFNAEDGSGIHLYEVNMSEEDADNFLSQLLKYKKIRFAQEGTGENLKTIEDIGDYALRYNEALIEKLSAEVQPEHDAANMEILPRFDSYPRQLFPVQGHASTASVKHLKNHKAVLIQGEMSTGKSTMMTAMADGTFNRDSIEQAVAKSKGYHVCLMSPPSLLDKWPKEIRALIPEAEIHVIRKTAQLIQYHTKWMANGRQKPRKPIFFIISFNTMRDGARIEPAVEYQYKATTIQKSEEAAYKQGFYCPDCGKPHQAVEDVEKYI
ncbi:helicase, partial [Butyricicoccus sp. 1XD8-22]